MYDDINRVLEDVNQWFGEHYGESFSFERDPRDRFARYVSKSYEFEVSADFVHARTSSDFLVPIGDRLEEVLKNFQVDKGKRYRLSTKNVDKPMPTEYCVEQIN